MKTISDSHSRRARRKQIKRTLASAFCIFLLCAALFSAVKGFTAHPQDGSHTPGASDAGQERTEAERDTKRGTAELNADQNLILVNSTHRIPKNYKPKLKTLSNGESVSTEIYPALQKMFDDARAQGLAPFVAAGYRTAQKQQELLDEKIREFRKQGYSASEAKKQAQTWVAVPGTSEHQLGLAVDINADTEKCSSDRLYSWLEKNSFQYGFILRYPSDKTAITGTNYEPWHFRYVGVPAAAEIHARGICLEEYLNQTQ